MSAPHVDPATFPDLSGVERERAVAHLASCAACRAGVAAASPESLFALLSVEREPEELLEEVSAGVVRRLDGTRPSWIEALRERGLSRTAAGLAAAAAVVGFALLASRPPALPVAPLAADAARAGVTLVEPAPAAQVIDLTVGGTQVVMIFDPGMKL